MNEHDDPDGPLDPDDLAGIDPRRAAIMQAGARIAEQAPPLTDRQGGLLAAILAAHLRRRTHKPGDAGRAA